jgi:hypothetical protein
MHVVYCCWLVSLSHRFSRLLVPSGHHVATLSDAVRWDGAEVWIARNQGTILAGASIYFIDALTGARPCYLQAGVHSRP